MSVTNTASLPVSEDTVVFVSAQLHAERRRLGTRAGTRSLGCYRQAILVLRRLLDDTRIIQLAIDNQVSRSTGYAYLHEGPTVIADQAPGFSSLLLAAKVAGYAHVNIEGTLIETDRCRTPGPTAGVDLWWSGKHDNHGGNVQVITAPDGWPLWTSPARPGREHDTTAQRRHDVLPLLITWTDDDLRVLGDLGYEGEQATITVAFKKPKNRSCTKH
jgi:DDE superfamily endonuclease